METDESDTGLGLADQDRVRLWRTAQTLGRRAHARKAAGRPWPALIFVTDPLRTPDPVAIAARLPRGAAILYRAFGAADATRTARDLAAVARGRGLVLLIGSDEGLAVSSGAHGLHLPERELARAVRLRRRRPDWLITGGAHSAWALRVAAHVGLDAALLSAVFASRSPSAGAPLGPVRFAAMVRAAPLPVFALGGVNGGTAARLLGSGAVGVAAVEALLGEVSKHALGCDVLRPSTSSG